MAIILLAVELIQIHQYHQLDKTDVPYLDKNSDFGLGDSAFQDIVMNVKSSKEKARIKYFSNTVERLFQWNLLRYCSNINVLNNKFSYEVRNIHEIRRKEKKRKT